MTLHASAQPTPVQKAHAHNDYYHDRPLLDALDNGFCSVEADVFLADGKLLVGHSKNELKQDRTLSKLYLDPLRDRVKANSGRVFKNGPTITLLVDIKSDGKSTYLALDKELTRYAEMLSIVEDSKLKVGAVQVVVSGNRDFETIAKSNPRYVGIDGRLSDLGSTQPGHLMPMISDNWRLHFKWRGDGDMPNDERNKLQAIVKTSHKAGRTVRMWATPEKEALWKELLSADVDHINTDDLPRLRRFLQNAK
ncbi:MAG: phosphatidylinositol-specific phospholipase C/glycerophosphodiester phosphodiesterase family protein [Planctomycetales bacterium]|nr:phosphatidylinositol-specific phospholipase C/glycerophosphodiester phosphodiesterase family protein [Planctomycetales bacterium]